MGKMENIIEDIDHGNDLQSVIEDIDDDDDLDDRYKNSKTQVQFHSLKNFQPCDDVKEYLDLIRAEISNNSASTSSNTSTKRTSLFLQDFPSEVDGGAFEGLQRLKADIDPRYFWVSLRNDSIEAENIFRDFLGFEV